MSTTVVLTENETITEVQKLDQTEGDQNNEEQLPTRDAELYIFRDCEKGLGLKICGGCSQDGEEIHGVFVKRIIPGGQADLEGGLQRGDQILEVNGNSLEGVTNERAVSHLRLACASNYVEILVCRDAEAQQEFKEIMEKLNSSVPGTPVPLEAETPTDDQTKMNGVRPKHGWAGPRPNMASTPHGRAHGRGSSGSQYTFMQGEPSPVGHHQSTHHTTDLTNGSVFLPQATPSLPKYSDMSNTQKFSIEERIKVANLKTALCYLELEPTDDQEKMMLSRLQVDAAGTARYGDVEEVVKEVFQTELKTKSGGLGTMLYAAYGLTGQTDSLISHAENSGGASGDTPDQVQGELEELRQENMRLQVLLREKENEMLKMRKEAQGIIHEQRMLQSKVHLAAQAQKVARDMEHDYEEVLQLLEGEIASLKLQLNRQNQESDPITARRLAVLTCQLKKSEGEKNTFKVATEKLLKFAESVSEMFSESGATSRPLGGLGAKAKGLMSKQKSSSRNVKHVAEEAQDVVKTVRSLLDLQPLPFGWDETYTEDGIKYYINHLNQVTTWTHPLSNVTHLPMESKDFKPEPVAKGNNSANDNEAKPSTSTEQ